MFEDFDELARGLAENDISRRQAIKWAGYAVAGATLSSIGFADTAEALSRRGRRRCRRKGGTPLEKGDCHCGYNCGEDSDLFECQDDPNCFCTKTTEGRGFCIENIRCDATCSTSSQCPTGWKCVVTCCGTTCAPPCGTEAMMSSQQDGASGARHMTHAGPSGA